MAKSQNELDDDLKNLNKVIRVLHVDVVDGKFVNNKTFDFDFILSKDYVYRFHLMVKEPIKWIKNNKILDRDNIELIIPHFEELDDIETYISLMRKNEKKISMAILPETEINSIEKYLKELDYLLILTVQPGFYGSKFLESNLNKVKQAKKINPNLQVIIDGGMNPETIKLAALSGADNFISGSYVTKADNPKQRIKTLLQSIKSIK